MSDSTPIIHTSQPNIEKEWCLLQNQYDSYEKFSLIIKLVNCVTFTLVFLNNQLNGICIALLAVIWLQDAIWKTFQARIENRLLELESTLSNNKNRLDEQLNNSLSTTAFQYNRQFMQNRPSTLGLIFEYLSQAVKPTIAFPHVILIGIAFLANLS